MAKCWEQRGCDEDMQNECPHHAELRDKCPTKCAFATCDRPTYELTIDPALIFEPTIDRSKSIKEGCQYCAFYLTNGPRVGE